jgi:hypothetical protein
MFRIIRSALGRGGDQFSGALVDLFKIVAVGEDKAIISAPKKSHNIYERFLDPDGIMVRVQ